jgi:hypothetical protein
LYPERYISPSSFRFQHKLFHNYPASAFSVLLITQYTRNAVILYMKSIAGVPSHWAHPTARLYSGVTTPPIPEFSFSRSYNCLFFGSQLKK